VITFDGEPVGGRHPILTPNWESVLCFGNELHLSEEGIYKIVLVRVES